MRQNLRSAEPQFPRRVAASFNHWLQATPGFPTPRPVPVRRACLSQSVGQWHYDQVVANIGYGGLGWIGSGHLHPRETAP